MRAPFWPLLVLLGVASAGACSLLNPLDGYSGGDAALADAAPQIDAGLSDVATPEAGEAGPACTSARPPPRPEGQLGGDLVVVNAIRTFEFGEANDPQKPTSEGLDLDSTCTCPGTRSCRPVLGAGTCDFLGGVDNAAGPYFISLVSVLGKDNSVSARIARGQYGLTVRIKNYNGLADDDEVEVAIFNSFGLDVSTGDAGTDGSTDAGSVRTTPQFDGNDRWTVDAKSLLGGTAYLPNIVDTRAYVRGFTVVATLSNSIRVGPYTVPIVGGTLLAHIVKSGDTFACDRGTISGRTNARELLTALESVPNPIAPSSFLCGEDSVFKNVRDRFCQTLDITTDPTLDGRDAPCDAASFSVRFTSSPALLGAVVDNGRPQKPCGESWVATCPTQ